MLSCFENIKPLQPPFLDDSQTAGKNLHFFNEISLLLVFLNALANKYLLGVEFYKFLN